MEEAVFVVSRTTQTILQGMVRRFSNSTVSGTGL